MSSLPAPSTPSPPPPRSPLRPTRSFWRRVVVAQEFGLVVVIAVMMLALWAFSGTKPAFTAKTLPSNTVVEERDGGAGGFSLTIDGVKTDYQAPNDEGVGFTLRRNGDEVILREMFRASRFLSKDNIMSVLTTASFIAIMAVGMTGIIVMGGIDLSVGSIYALAAVIGAMVLETFLGTMNAPMAGAPPSTALAILITVGVCSAVGAACGLINGVATVGLKVHPFIITLGGMAVYRGIAFVSTKGQTIGPFPESYTKSFGKAEFWDITPVPMLIMVVVGLVGAFVLTRTVFGRQTFAIGGNETAAKYAGIAVGKVKVWLFVICGALAGLSAAVALGYFGAGGSDSGKGYELNVIAAAVVGGASLSGGRGSAIGAVLGAIIIQLIDNSILMLNVDQNYKEIVIGLAIVLAVVVDQTKQRLGSRR